MQFIPAALAVGGSVLKGVGGLKAGKQNKRALYGQAREAENTGAAQELRIREEARRALGQQVAAQWGNGFTGDSGSALDAVTESQVNAAMDALSVRREAAAKARGYRAEGDQRLREGKMALAQGLIGAGSAAFGMKDDWAQVRRGISPAGGN